MPAPSRRAAPSTRSCRRPIPAAGVAAASGGNHGAAVAYAARQLGIKARIFVPEISSPAKIAVIRVARRRGRDRRRALRGRAGGLRRLCRRDRGAARPSLRRRHHHRRARAPSALEWEEDGPPLDTVLVAVGGGGLICRHRELVGGPRQGRRRRARGLAGPACGACGRPAGRRRGRIRSRPIRSARAMSATSSTRSCRDTVDHVALVTDDGDPRRARRALARLAHRRGARRRGGARGAVSGAYRPAPGERVGVLLCGANVELSTIAALSA